MSNIIESSRSKKIFLLLCQELKKSNIHGRTKIEKTLKKNFRTI